MPGEFKRLFVGNLPPGVTESDLEKEFSAYGEVQKVELKRKENLVEPENPLLFAFINTNIASKSLDLCLDEFSRHKFRGRLLTVSVARESFLDRLKREREEAAGKENKVAVQLETSKPTPQKTFEQLPRIAKEVGEASSSSEESESEEDEGETAPATTPSIAGKSKEDEEDEDAFVTKKRASASLYNGKIKIQSTSSEPIHIISRNQKNDRQLDEQAKKADQKRKESQNKMKNQYNQQKLAIQNALADVDRNKRKRIVFDDEEMPNGDMSHEIQSKKNKLFDDDDDEENEDVTNYEKDFKIKTQFLGKDGDKLLKLQSKYNLDRRFQLDERFVENEEDGENNESIKDDSKEVNDERSWQLGIIEQVIGRKFETLSAPHKRKLEKTMLRFDPGKEEHQKFLQNVAKVAQTFKNDKQRKEDGNEVEVSKEQFYSVNDDLTKSLKTRGDGFSLISMFGKADEDTEKQSDDREPGYEEKILIGGKPKKGFLNNAFKYDSSESEDEEELDSDAVPKREQTVKENQKVAGGTTTKKGVRVENFFFFEEDERLKEGKSFFEAVKTKDGEVEDYDKVKDRLRQIINKKIVKSRKGDNRFKNKNKFKRK